MKWMSRQLVLPILLGLSLTGVSVALIYLVCKKDEDEEFHRKSPGITKRQVIVECKVPRKSVPAVIGRAGSTIKDLESKTATRIFFHEDNIDSPDRVCVIRGNNESVRLAEEMIKNIIANQPIIETYEMYIPQKVCGRIIGRGGEIVKQIQMSSSAKIIIEGGCASHDPNAERRVIIKGKAEQIAAALSQIEDKVREEKVARSKLEVSSTSRLPRGKLSPRNTAVNSTDNIQSTEVTPLQVADGLMEVYVSAMESPSQFWVQVVGPGTTALDKLVSEMTAYYNEEENREIHALRNISLGQMVAAKFTFDEQWYRAEVIGIPDDGCCEVYFVDYGDHEVVDTSSVLELRTDFLSLRLQAVECSLANVKPRENEWSNEACDKFSELTWLAEWKVLVAKVRGYKERALSYGRSRREGSPIPSVDLYDKNNEKEINVGQELINEGFAEAEESSSAASSTLSLSTRSHDFPTISSPASTPPLTKHTSSPEDRADTSKKAEEIRKVANTTPLRPKIEEIEEIDLTTPRKPVGPIEEIDLVTPVKDETGRFVENERRRARRENGAGDCLRNGGSNQRGKSSNAKFKIAESARFAPAGYESDLSDNSDLDWDQ